MTEHYPHVHSHASYENPTPELFRICRLRRITIKARNRATVSGGASLSYRERLLWAEARDVRMQAEIDDLARDAHPAVLAE